MFDILAIPTNSKGQVILQVSRNGKEGYIKQTVPLDFYLYLQSAFAAFSKNPKSADIAKQINENFDDKGFPI